MKKGKKSIKTKKAATPKSPNFYEPPKIYYLKVSSKGQITLPVELRRELEIKEGAELTAEVKEKKIKIERNADLWEVIGSIPKPKVNLTLEELNQARQEFWESRKKES